MAARHLSAADFKELVSNGHGVALVDFWATWCGPCRMLGPVIDEIADELDGINLVGKIDIDAERDTTAAYGVMSVPTLIFFKDGKEAARMVGVQAKQKIIAQIKAL